MKQLTFCIALALVILSGCAKDPQIAQLADEAPSVQTSTTYDPYSVESVVLHSHSIYGPMIWNDPNIDFAASNGGGVLWNGPWVDGCGPYPCPDPKPEGIGHCRGKDTVCLLVISASGSVANIFQAEGLSASNYNSPAVLIRAYMGHSNIVLVDNFSNNNSTGVHQFDVISAL